MRRKADLRSKSPEPMASVQKENEVMGLLRGDHGTQPPSQLVPGSVSREVAQFVIPTPMVGSFPLTSQFTLNCVRDTNN